MSNEEVLLLTLIQVVEGLAAAVYYLTYAVSTLAVVGLVGYLFAPRSARAPRPPV